MVDRKRVRFSLPCGASLLISLAGCTPELITSDSGELSSFSSSTASTGLSTVDDQSSGTDSTSPSDVKPTLATSISDMLQSSESLPEVTAAEPPWPDVMLAEPVTGVFWPIVGVPNIDDDDASGERDWFESPVGSDNDWATYPWPQWLQKQVTSESVVTVAIEANDELKGRFRIWHHGEVVLGEVNGDTVWEASFEAESLEVPLRAEFSDFALAGQFSVQIEDEPGKVVSLGGAAIVSSPLLLNHHAQPAERAWAVAVSSNESMIADFTDVLGDEFVAVSSFDVWIQDELEWGTATAPGVRLNVAVDSIRDRGLDSWVKGLEAKDYQPMTWGIAGEEVSEDKFGNLEVTPPLSVDGVEYPYGRIYYGDDGGEYAPHHQLKKFLDKQKLQRPFAIDTSWLCVGHVDEFVSFLPDKEAPRGFRFLVSDVDAAYALLETMPRETLLPRYATGHGYATVGELLDDQSLRELNDSTQNEYLEPAVQIMRSELDLSEEEIIRLPGLFEPTPCSYKPGNVVSALIPGMLNLTAVDSKSRGEHIFVSDPFLRSDDAKQDTDPLIDLFRTKMPLQYDIHFVDDWYTYHMLIGEVHCGSNVERTPPADWWARGSHLFGGEN